MSSQGQSDFKQFLFYDPIRVDYSVTPQELVQIESASSNLWKDVALVSAPLGISCLINAISGTTEPFELSFSLFLNYLFGVIGIGTALVFSIAWHKTNQQFSNLLKVIKDKPKQEIVIPPGPGTVMIGAMQSSTLHPESEGDYQDLIDLPNSPDGNAD